MADISKANPDLASRHCERVALYDALLPDSSLLGCRGADLLFGCQRIWMVALDTFSEGKGHDSIGSIQHSRLDRGVAGHLAGTWSCGWSFHESSSFSVSHGVSRRRFIPLH